MKKDLPWFYHYNSTHNEPRMQALLAEYGFEGYGRFWILLEKIAASPEAILDLSSRVIKLTVMRDLEMNAEHFDSFIEFLSALDINLIRVENNIITSNQIQEYYCQVAKKRITNKTSYQNSLTDNQFQTSENTQSRVDQSSSDKSSSSTETTTTFLNICKSLGYSIGSGTAQEITSGMDPAWLSGAFTYPEYIAEAILKNYAEKPPEEKRKLFRTILAKEDRKKDFPDWRRAKEEASAAEEKRLRQEAEGRAKQTKLNEARAGKPTTCTNCGEELEYKNERGYCPSCDYRCYFNEKTSEWTISPPVTFEALHESLGKRSNVIQNEEIDF